MNLRKTPIFKGTNTNYQNSRWVVYLLFAATMLTTTDVVVDDDWNKTVARIPIMRPTTGLESNSLSAKIEPAARPASKEVESSYRNGLFLISHVFNST